MVDDNREDEILTPSDIGRKLIVALRSVTDPQALMQSIADRSALNLRNELIVQIDAINKAIEVAHDDLVRVPTEVQKTVGALQSLVEARLLSLSAVDEHSTKQREMLLEHLNENLRSARDYLQSELTGNKQLYMEKFVAIEETIKVLKDTINDRFTQNDQNTEKAFNAAKQAVGERDASNAASANKSEKNMMDALAKLDDNVKTLSGTMTTQVSSNKQTLDDKIDDLKEQMARLDNRISSGESSKKGSGDAVTWLFAGLTLLVIVVGAVVSVIALGHH